ncbi:MAG: IS200/IS605 family transposase [Epsilonproteobacteria bacterium]|nr:IS200/IS605 family transposase [Campylobacterota bacterium]
MEIEKSRYATYLLRAYLTFLTKEGNALGQRELVYLKKVFQETLNNFGGKLIEFEGEMDKVFLHIGYPPKHSIALIVNTLKGRSSRLLRKKFPRLAQRSGFWNRNYFAFSSGAVNLEKVKRIVKEKG